MKRLLPLLLLLSINACSNDETEIQKILNKRWRALETGDINLYSECISPDYKGREELIKRIEDNLKRIDSLKVLPQEPAIYINTDIATVYQEVRLIITIGENTQNLETREKLTLRKTKVGWRITGGIK